MRELIEEMLSVYGMKASDDLWVGDLIDDLVELVESTEAQQRSLVKRMAMTGAFTYGSVHLERLSSWGKDNPWKVSEGDVDAWLNDTERNVSVINAYELARLMLGG